MSLVRRFERNEAGRDYVVGDIHGCFDRLRSVMAMAKFDESVDRLFSVGDLVDRGPSSEEAVDWIARPWFHAVRGNHEQMAIGVADGRHDRGNYEINGGGWFLLLPDARKKVIAEVFNTLPVAIEIDHPLGRIGIVHAEIYGDSWDQFVTELEADSSKNERRNLLEYALWSRARWQANKSGYDTAPITDLHCLFVGHTPMDKPTAMANVVYLDTGAVFGGRLTMVDIADCRVMEEAA